MKLLLSMIPCFCYLATFAGLSPAANSEFCPNTNISFTYTVSGNYTSAYFSNNVYTTGSVSSVSYASGITTISFTLYFTDISLDHSIQLNFTDGSNSSYDVLPFSKIKSLYGYTDVPSLNVSTITVDSCATSTTSVSFETSHGKISQHLPQQHLGLLQIMNILCQQDGK